MPDRARVKITISEGMISEIESEIPLSVQIVDLDILEYDDEADIESFWDVEPSEEKLQFGAYKEDR